GRAERLAGDDRVAGDQRRAEAVARVARRVSWRRDRLQARDYLAVLDPAVDGRRLRIAAAVDRADHHADDPAPVELARQEGMLGGRRDDRDAERAANGVRAAEVVEVRVCEQDELRRRPRGTQLFDDRVRMLRRAGVDQYGHLAADEEDVDR